MDRGKGGCQQAATHKVNKPTRAVQAADLAETRRVSRTIPSISPIALPRLLPHHPVQRRQRLGGILSYYHRAAAWIKCRRFLLTSRPRRPAYHTRKIRSSTAFPCVEGTN